MHTVQCKGNIKWHSIYFIGSRYTKGDFVGRIINKSMGVVTWLYACSKKMKTPYKLNVYLYTISVTILRYHA